jgi:hypothetical protein
MKEEGEQEGEPSWCRWFGPGERPWPVGPRLARATAEAAPFCREGGLGRAKGRRRSPRDGAWRMCKRGERRAALVGKEQAAGRFGPAPFCEAGSHSTAPGCEPPACQWRLLATVGIHLAARTKHRPTSRSGMCRGGGLPSSFVMCRGRGGSLPWTAHAHRRTPSTRHVETPFPVPSKRAISSPARKPPPWSKFATESAVPMTLGRRYEFSPLTRKDCRRCLEMICRPHTALLTARRRRGLRINSPRGSDAAPWQAWPWDEPPSRIVVRILGDFPAATISLIRVP